MRPQRTSQIPHLEKDSGSGFHALLVKAASLWLGSLIMMLMLVALAFATAFESARGTQVAKEVFYDSLWFKGLLTLLCLNILAAIAIRWKGIVHRFGFFATHAGIITILLGALVTSVWGERGQMTIEEGSASGSFLIEGTAALVATFDDSEPIVKDLGPWIESGAHDGNPGPTIREGSIAIKTKEFFRDSEWVDTLIDGDGDSPSAVKIEIAVGDRVEDAVIFEGRSAILLDRVVSFRLVGDEDSLQRLIHANSDDEVLSVVVQTLGREFRIPVEGNVGRDVPLEETGLIARIDRYLPHASVGGTKKVVNLSNRPVNPYAEVSVRRMDISDSESATYHLFARFPEFGTMHRSEIAHEAKVVLVAPQADVPVTPIEVIAGPAGRCHVRFSTPDMPVSVKSLPEGRRVRMPWNGATISLVDFRRHGRLDRILHAMEPPRKEPKPGCVIEVDGGGEVRLIGMRQFDHGTLSVGGRKLGLAFSALSRKLDFSVRLDDFHIDQYPGMGRPRAFVSEVRFESNDGESVHRATISMNRPATHGEYTFFQSSYETGRGREATILSVARDPGEWVVFSGYILTLLGMLVVFFQRLGRERRQRLTEEAGTENGSQATRHVGARGRSRELAIMLITAFSLFCAATARAQLPHSIDYDVVRGLVVQHDGRWPPLDTAARDIVWSVTGDAEFLGEDPVGLLLGWTFDPPRWMQTPLIPVKNPELRRAFGLSAHQERFSFLELIDHETLRPLMQRAATLASRKPDALEEKALSIRKKLLTLQRVWSGQAIRPIPHPNDADGAWSSIPGDSAGGVPSPDGAPTAWRALRTAYVEDDAAGFSVAATALQEAIAQLATAHIVDRDRLASELLYNRINPFRLAAWGLGLGWLLAVASMFLRRRWVDVAAFLALFSGFSFTTWGLYLRWQFAGRIPASNMYESLLFLAWGTSLFAVVATVVQRQRLVPFTAAFMAALTMLLCNVLPMDGFVRPIAPVLLGTVWMSIHVPIIMVSYSILAIAVLVAHLQLSTMAFFPARETTIRKLDAMHYWYVHLGSILLTLGIVTGSMWASSSWGRYWGWDPKEVWSLIALLGYMVIVHTRGDRGHTSTGMLEAGGVFSLAILGLIAVAWGRVDIPLAMGVSSAVAALLVFLLVRGVFATAVKSIVCFWLVIMTYVGVNYVLGTGMHSYGFGKGAVVRHVTRIAVAELAFIGACAAILAWRSARTPPEAIPLSGPVNGA